MHLRLPVRIPGAVSLHRFGGLARAKGQKIAFEIAMLGSGGLNLIDPTEQHSLRAISRKFSGLQLLRIQYVGFQIIEPSLVPDSTSPPRMKRRGRCTGGMSHPRITNQPHFATMRYTAPLRSAG